MRLIVSNNQDDQNTTPHINSRRLNQDKRLRRADKRCSSKERELTRASKLQAAYYAALTSSGSVHEASELIGDTIQEHASTESAVSPEKAVMDVLPIKGLEGLKGPPESLTAIVGPDGTVIGYSSEGAAQYIVDLLNIVETQHMTLQAVFDSSIAFLATLDTDVGHVSLRSDLLDTLTLCYDITSAWDEVDN